MDIKELFSLLGILLTIVVGFWGVIKFLMAYTDNAVKMLKADTEAQIKEIKEAATKERNERIAFEAKSLEIMEKIKENHVRRDDFIELKTGITTLGSSMNTRMDNVVNMITQLVLKGNGKNDSN